MNAPSFLSTLVLFGRMAVRRTLNQSAQMKFPARKGAAAKTAADGTAAPAATPTAAPAAEAAPRTATVHRSQRQSLLRRALGMWLPIMALLGTILLSVNTMFVLIDSNLLLESRAAKTLPLTAAQYKTLGETAALPTSPDRDDRINSTLAEAYSSSAAWLTDSMKELARSRFDKEGMAAFRELPADPQWSGTFAWLSPAGRERALHSLGLYLLLINVALVAVGFGASGRNLGNADPALVWLWQFPVSRSVLFTAKLVESVCGSLAAPLTSLFYAIVLWQCGTSFLAGLGLGALLGLSAAFAGGAIRLAAEIVMTQTLGRRTRGSIVAVATAVGSLASLVAMTGSNSQMAVEMFGRWAQRVPASLYWNPFSAGLGAVSLENLTAQPWWLVAPATALLLSTLAVLLASALTRAGLACCQDSGRDVHQPTAARTSLRLTGLGTVAWKELLQMGRQPEVLGQMLAAPLTIGVLLTVGGYQKAVDLATQGGANVCVAILVAAAYMLMVAATQSVSRELKMLTFLQSQPQPLADIIRSKARVWGVMAVLLGLPFLGGVIAWYPSETTAILVRTPFLLASIWWLTELMFGLTALAASVTNEQTVRFRSSVMWIPALILSDAAIAVYSQNWWLQAGVLAMLVILNAAVRERQLVELAWLSEPVETPPRRVYPMHGLLALIAFQTLIGVFGGLLRQAEFLSAAAATMTAYCLSAALVMAGCWVWLHEHKLSIRWDHPRGPILRPMLQGLSLSCAVGFAVVTILKHFELQWQTPAHVSDEVIRHGSYDKWYLFVLFVIAAPLFEEWVFRGLLYRSLRRSWGIALSVGVTAVLFATLHPVAGSVALVTLGATTALTAERTGRLWPSIAVHAGYNLMVWGLCVA